jgi:hypothetical protein
MPSVTHLPSRKDSHNRLGATGLHTQFVGEILDAKIDESVLGQNGNPDVQKIRAMVFGGGAYHSIGAFLGKAFEIGKGF